MTLINYWQGTESVWNQSQFLFWSLHVPQIKNRYLWNLKIPYIKVTSELHKLVLTLITRQSCGRTNHLNLSLLSENSICWLTRADDEDKGGDCILAQINRQIMLFGLTVITKLQLSKSLTHAVLDMWYVLVLSTVWVPGPFKVLWFSDHSLFVGPT